MDFVKGLAGGNKEGGSSGDNTALNKGIDAAQSTFLKAGQGTNDQINRGIDTAQGVFLGDKKTEQKPVEEKK
ncbi:hypothetical protein MGYG_00670 [Nannizzia gypsea CBS 118893]|uniref:Uncharacterized protein n=1 Tax=Arthroderma gypseum (strain ATCC MYA-4604 / CBS 118893) TaxID=535722 RepID=E5R128_ARTGP|nr:hypothetical protein MGYG_00670 [Nannizzia gypsea CBS 118893]EFQ97632.1 hypothetical protein MGYG_00670 [Nannizzia gypsea CBS 118893]